MLKINLLPTYIYEKRKVKQTTLVFAVLFVGVAAGMMAWNLSLGAKKTELTAQVADMQQKANEVKAIEAQATAEEQRIPVIQGKVQFIENVMQYNLQYPKLYEELAKYTYNRIMYTSVDPSGGQFKIAAHARSLGDCGRYLLNMYRASHLFSGVSIDGVPGWPSQSAQSGQGFDFNVTCNLAQPVAQPAYTPGGGAPAAPGAPGQSPQIEPPPPAM